MTSAAVSAAPAATDGVAWRALPSGLWVARRDGRHLGTVQHGHRWLATGVDGEPIGSFRSFREAQSAVSDPAAHPAPVGRASAAVPALAVAALGVVAALSVAAMLSTSGWAWTALVI